MPRLTKIVSLMASRRPWRNWLLPLLFLAAAMALYFTAESRRGADTEQIRQDHPNRFTQKGVSLPKANGHREGCLVCHGDMKGFSKSHDPQAIGCSSCHLGNPFTLDKDKAHTGMVLIPGNLDTADKSCGECHRDISERIHTSLMATGRGMVSVNRFVFGEKPTPDDPHAHLSQLGHTPADSHLRRLCASCHLDNKKVDYAPISQTSRGGGCTACHLNYSDKAQKGLKRFKDYKELPKHHPSLDLRITDDHCFGCHSRSGRTATNFEGWHETQLSPSEVDNWDNYRKLEDGRIFQRETADVHHKSGLACIDCHTSRETMGDGKIHLHQHSQTQVRCSDCHFAGEARTMGRGQLDEESKKIIDLHDIDNPTDKFLRIAKSGRPLVNAFINQKGEPVLQGKLSGKIHPLKAPDSICTRDLPGHDRLSCKACHADWAPHCIACHTQYNSKTKGYDHLLKEIVQGAWHEYKGPYLAEPPTLGVRLLTKEGGNEEHNKEHNKEIIDTFIPGMVLTINRNDPVPGQVSDNYQTFRRLYSPTSPHTTTRKGRSCESCHNDPVALGYGRGKLTMRRQGGYGLWSFDSKYAAHAADGLPQDAWIDFLQTRPYGQSSTRSNARPLSHKEQKKVLTVGTCLKCHDDSPRNIRRIYGRFDWAKENMTPRCLKPRFPGQ